MAVGDVAEREERPAWVQFETRTIENKRESLKSGHYVGKDVDFVLVTPAYSKDCYEQKVELWFESVDRNVKNGRMPREWADHWRKAYQAWKQGQEIPVNGTPIKGWSVLSPSQEKMLLSLNVRTIEDLAAANDEGLRRMGMGGVDLRNKAIAWLKSSQDHGMVTQENAALLNENRQLKGTIESLEGKIKSLQQQVQNIAEVNIETFRPESGITAEDILESTQEVSDLDILREEYKKTFGKTPHHLMREKGIIAKLGLKGKQLQELGVNNVT